VSWRGSRGPVALEVVDAHSTALGGGIPVVVSGIGCGRGGFGVTATCFSGLAGA